MATAVYAAAKVTTILSLFGGEVHLADVQPVLLPTGRFYHTTPDGLKTIHY